MVLKALKPYMMPLAMTIGILFYPWLSKLAFLTPYLIFIMLFFTYSKMKFSEIRLSKMHYILISIQIIGSVAVYLALRPFNEILAQGAMICVLAPTATSAPVITGMLGGSVESLMTYSLLSNMTIILSAPIFFSYIGEYQQVPFFVSFLSIAKQIVLLLFVPLVIAYFLRKIKPTTLDKVAKRAGLSFYIWTFALIIVTARTVNFISLQGSESYQTEFFLAIATFLICGLQFYFGRKIGRKYDDTVAGGQGLGQKNTVLAIWMAQIYLNPLASVGPGAYVLWQNAVNSLQVWRKRKSL